MKDSRRRRTDGEESQQGAPLSENRENERNRGGVSAAQCKLNRLPITAEQHPRSGYTVIRYCRCPLCPLPSLSDHRRRTEKREKSHCRLSVSLSDGYCA